jgi:hypothetical protein
MTSKALASLEIDRLLTDRRGLACLMPRWYELRTWPPIGSVRSNTPLNKEGALVGAPEWGNSIASG